MKYFVLINSLLAMRKFSIPLIVITLITSCANDGDMTVDIRAEMMNSINQIRKNGCRCGSDEMPPVPSLTWNSYLQAAALRHAMDMHERNYLNHISPEGASPAQRAMEAGYVGHDVGENIGRGYWTVIDIIKGWQDSEVHCKAIMSDLYSEMGAANQDSYWVLNLGNPY
jgi:uncharacterized protein YkwD